MLFSSLLICKRLLGVRHTPQTAQPYQRYEWNAPTAGLTSLRTLQANRPFQTTNAIPLFLLDQASDAPLCTRGHLGHVAYSRRGSVFRAQLQSTHLPLLPTEPDRPFCRCMYVHVGCDCGAATEVLVATECLLLSGDEHRLHACRGTGASPVEPAATMPSLRSAKV